MRRNWTDGNRNYMPDCDLLNPLAQNNLADGRRLLLGRSTTRRSDGRRRTRVFDPDLLTGWGKRYYNWEFSAGVQHEILPRVSVDVGYFRRWYGNFVVQDNRAVAAADYDSFSVTAPRDPRLPDGGGYTVSGFKNLEPAGVRPPGGQLHDARRQLRQADRALERRGRRRQRTSRQRHLRPGRHEHRPHLHRQLRDPERRCPKVNVRAALPYCHQDTNWLTQFKGAASYTDSARSMSRVGDLPVPARSRDRGQLGGAQRRDRSRRSAGRSRAAPRTQTVNLVDAGHRRTTTG